MNTPANPQVSKALTLAYRLHDGQFRRDSVTPYIEHVKQVVKNVIKRGGGDDDITVAWLHDIIEDTPCTPHELRSEFPAHIVEAVLALTHNDSENYLDAIKRARANPIARKVKIADNLANLSDDPSDKQIMKYSKSLQVLMT